MLQIGIVQVSIRIRTTSHFDADPVRIRILSQVQTCWKSEKIAFYSHCFFFLIGVIGVIICSILNINLKFSGKSVVFRYIQLKWVQIMIRKGRPRMPIPIRIRPKMMPIRPDLQHLLKALRGFWVSGTSFFIIFFLFQCGSHRLRHGRGSVRGDRAAESCGGGAATQVPCQGPPLQLLARVIVAALLRMQQTNIIERNTTLLIIQLVRKRADMRQNHCDTNYVCRKRPYLVVAQEKKLILINRMTEAEIGVMLTYQKVRISLISRDLQDAFYKIVNNDNEALF